MKKQERAAVAEEMQYHIRSWQHSNQSQKNYCAENNLSYPKFIYWLHRNREGENLPDQVFIPVKTKPAARTSVADVEITYPNGVRLRVSPDSFEYISRLIRLV